MASILSKRFFGIAVIAIGIAAVAGLLFAYQAKANPSRVQYPVSCTTQGQSASSISTTSVAYMSAGNATTTLTCNQSLAGLGTEIFDTATVAVQLTGSSTATTLRWSYEYSQDGIDWYGDNTTYTLGSTSPAYSASVVNTYNMNFSSTSPGGASGISSRMLRLISVPVPTKYFRVNFTLPAGSLNGAVWAGVVGKSEKP